MRASIVTSIQLVLASALLAVVCQVGTAADKTATTVVTTRIEASLPKPWAVVARTSGVLPEGHYWGQEYSGGRGDEIVLQGGADVHVSWQDKKGEWHTESVGKEALKLYVMPADYRENWRRFLLPKRPVAARLLFDGQAFKIYAYPSFRVLEKERLDQIVMQGQAIRWPDSPENTGTLSWVSWSDDIQRLLRAS